MHISPAMTDDYIPVTGSDVFLLPFLCDSMDPKEYIFRPHNINLALYKRIIQLVEKIYKIETVMKPQLKLLKIR